MDKKYTKEIYERYLLGNVTPEEEQLVKEWLMFGEFPKSGLSELEIKNSLARVEARLPLGQTVAPAARIAPLWKWAAIAASIVLAIGAGILYYNTKNVNTVNQYATLKSVHPGSNKAFLVLGNGKRISLTDAANGDLAQEAGVVVNKTADGQLLYTISAVKNNSTTPVYNTIETPKGGQHQVRLPDGSNVWLNASSSLRFLLNAGQGRRVELSGEAYFEVAKDKAHPFVVASKGQEVQVLGTHFNVNTYSDEPVSKTTLLEGSVRVSAHGSSKLIVPGQQAVLGDGGLSITEVNVDDVVAWKNGKFVFEDEPVSSVMRKLARWYDVDVVFEEGAGDKLVTASISRFDNVSKILEKIKYIKAANFKIEGRRIIVMK